MGLSIIENPVQSTILLPITFIFWGYIIAYIIHILDEALLGETFVGMVKNLFWPEYEWKHFFGFNTLLLSLNIIGIVLFDTLNGLWIIFPLSFIFLYTTNGLWHLFSTIITKKYSPGLATSIIYWVLFYFLCRYSFFQKTIDTYKIVISGVIGTSLTVLMIGSFFIFRKRFKKD